MKIDWGERLKKLRKRRGEDEHGKPAQESKQVIESQEKPLDASATATDLVERLLNG